MDGLTYKAPREKIEDTSKAQLLLFNDSPPEAPAPLCIIMDWQKGIIIKVNELKKRQTNSKDNMKFDVIIGNPPFDEEVEGNDRKKPIYNYFMDEAYKIGKTVELITPARFLFNAGQTPKAWNQKILMDDHFKVMHYEQHSDAVFQNVDIKGGVAITCHDLGRHYGAIKSFIPFDELRSVKDKVISLEDSWARKKKRQTKFLSEITVGAVPYDLQRQLKKNMLS